MCFTIFGKWGLFAVAIILIVQNQSQMLWCLVAWIIAIFLSGIADIDFKKLQPIQNQLAPAMTSPLTRNVPLPRLLKLVTNKS